ncbi:hypothetical protein FKR81_13045 [Lentzea tibetensis]|uniref:YCII-related domain-containing protein n=1 Tax=Lentzea tibetensis TaxID=2591470 RepID=A0A563EWC5_9PSEU|nr:YciI family protein [Lentzea tibetensis]TWP51781.1 hypothetical protein FKR81_13045 [Lentzea tibetensis]
MIVLEISFSEDGGQRLAARPLHREKLAALHAEGKLAMAGPWRDESGAMVVFNVEDEAAARVIMADDPYYATPGVTVVSLRPWNPIVGA